MPPKNDYNSIDYEDYDEPLYKYHDGKLLKGLYEYGFEKPTPIQAKCIKPIEDGRDLIAQSQFGSGKTGAFIIGSAIKIDVSLNYPQAIILANTRELANQIYEVANEILKFTGIKSTLCIGGTEHNNKIDLVIKNAIKSHILICTPGRMIGLINSNKELLHNIRIVILDEADLLLSDDFSEQIKSIIKSIPSKRQICLFSATTQSKNISNIFNVLVRDPVKLHIEREKLKVDQIKNYIVDAEEERHKFSILQDLYKNINICQAVIFVNTINKAIELFHKFKHEKASVGVIHRNLNDYDRRETLKKFRRTQIRILIATDIMARGIDVQQCGLIINYDIVSGENFEETYMHRVGRSGRFGKLGVAINLMTNNKDEWYKLKDISRKYNIKFSELPKLEEITYYLSGVDGYSYKE